MNRNLLILGFGGLGRVAWKAAVSMAFFETIHFLDDNKNQDPVIGKLDDAKQYAGEYAYAISAIGNNRMREIETKALKEIEFLIPVLIHSSAVVDDTAICREGVIVCANAVVSVCSIVNEGCVIGCNSVIGHDSHVECFSLIHDGGLIAPRAVVPAYSTVDYGQIVRT